MSDLDRRSFLEGSVAAAATGLGVARATAPSETVNVAVLGCGRGSGLARFFARLKESQVVAICDIDNSRAAALCRQIEQISGRRPEHVVDYRRLLERNDVDALA
ncbi:MAG: hypothetical protein VB859_12470, partial [Planctomycetaceae bacterium]